MCVCVCVCVCPFTDLFDLQPVAPDPLEQVTQAGDQSVLLQSSNVGLTMTQLHRLPSHLLHQHTLSLNIKHNMKIAISMTLGDSHLCATLRYWVG